MTMPHPSVELSSHELSGDVHPILHRLRAEAPVVWVPTIDRWLVTERELVLEALLDVATSTVDDPRFTTAQVVGPSMLSTDGAAHARHNIFIIIFCFTNSRLVKYQIFLTKKLLFKK